MVVEVQVPVHGVGRRPAAERPPLAGSRVEHGRLGELPVALSLQPVGEPLGLQLAVVESRRPAEAHVAERDPGVTEPLAVKPWAHHEMVEAGGVGVLEHPVGREGAVLVLLVPPAADEERWDGGVGEVAGERVDLPHRVVRGVLGETSPGGPAVRTDRLREGTEGREREIPVVGVVARR